MTGTSRYVVLSGGVGGAKFALGLSRVLNPAQLTIIANTGDDFEHLGLAISPDLDTLLYTLAGLVNEETGWGLKDETWSCLAGLGALGGDTWFRLGDRDLATHLERTRLLKAGQTLTAVTRHLCDRLGVTVDLKPMADTKVRTVLETDAGTLDFQDYFVRRKTEPVVKSIRYEGAAAAPPVAAFANLLTDPALAAVFIAPSNPWLSIDPILAIPSLRAALRSTTAPVIAISPIVGGKAIKGPTAKIMGELGIPVSAASVARHYGDLLDGYILDDADRNDATELVTDGLAVAATKTVMQSLEDRVALAGFALDFARGFAVRE
ncbi:MAG: 2-phospho-L-lactate transferase [Gammaproteobacteria bacterium]|nr:2-phospho-L-lactate transferase [Gammaproteobacteria bacterium]